ncbi:hypothetical protein M8J77_011472 [Diaphorina citri]|nr:hypothetical protein M8J77_011472 [Diaphorina citri]
MSRAWKLHRRRTNVNFHVPLHMAAVIRVVVAAHAYELVAECVRTRHGGARLGVADERIYVRGRERPAVNTYDFCGGEVKRYDELNGENSKKKQSCDYKRYKVYKPSKSKWVLHLN